MKLQPYRPQMVVRRSNEKMSPKYFGPYCIIDKIGEVAYKLRFPEATKVHSVFHVHYKKT